jgi:hypothetical protein
MEAQWKKESVSDFVSTADTDKSYNSKPSKDLPVWKKDEKKPGENSWSQSGYKVQEEDDIVVVVKRANKK